ncbi:MAG: serine/threonine protein kinase [Deltaproteobacteria bacterium]|nr:serine/threonine protein kinase [Deltaproteobacteria bacterium]
MNVCSKCGVEYDGSEVFCPKDGTRLGGTGEMPPQRTTIPPAEDPLVDSVIQGRYRVIKQIGEGGMGVVYVAEHVEIEKKVALKILRDDFSKRPEVVERFRQEARAASKIGHAHIVDVTDFGQLDDGGVYFVMGHLQGQGRSDLLRGKTLSLDRAVPIVNQIARALAAAHKLVNVHRDPKPENVFLVEREEEQDFVKILDFGIAKISDRDKDGERLTKTGMIFGTPEYMSPEQAAGKSLDHRVDVYALGCIMFEMFTGKVPFDGDSFMAVLTQHMFEPVPPIETIYQETDVPPSVRGVVYKAMAKDPDERYADMAEIEADLARALHDAGYIVDTPRHEPTGRISLENRGVAAGGKGTAMDWTPPSGSFEQDQKKGKTGIVVALMAVVLLFGGGAAAYFLGLFEQEGKTGRGENTGAANQIAPRQVADEKPDAPEVAKEGDTAKQGDAPAKEEKKKIKVQVKTDPEGAVIFIEGLGQVCSKAPCELELEEGSPMEVEARVDNRKAKMTFTPSAQNRELVLEVKKVPRRGGKKPKGGRGKNGKPTEGKGKSKTETSSTGLKIPGIFKDN